MTAPRMRRVSDECGWTIEGSPAARAARPGRASRIQACSRMALAPVADRLLPSTPGYHNLSMRAGGESSVPVKGPSAPRQQVRNICLCGGVRIGCRKPAARVVLVLSVPMVAFEPLLRRV